MLEELIRQLAERFGTPLFAPHATLCSGVWKKSEAELIEAVEKVGRSLRESRQSMKGGGIGWTDCWSNFFFLQLRGADDLFARVAEQIEGSNAPAVGPHLSLLYSFGDRLIDREALRAKLAGRLPKIICFDSLALVRPSTGRWEDVDSWEVRAI